MIDIKHLTVEFQKDCPVIEDITFSVEEHEIVGIVGESGSGKSMTAYAIMNLLPEDARITSGIVTRDILNISDIAMVYQEPMQALNPVMKVGKQVENAVRLHFSKGKKGGISKMEAKARAIQFMEEAGLSDCERLYHDYPHRLSGGMRQRILIAMALACKPRLIIADEPTTALDADMRTHIIERFRKINQKHGTAILLISHDIDAIAAICSRVIVMKDGHIIEENTLEEILQNPKDPYTQRLVASARAKQVSAPKETEIQSEKGCSLAVKHINGYYHDKERIKVLDDISFDIRPGEIFGLVGESGCGKSTLAKTIAGLMREAEGSILLNGQEINGLSFRKRKKYAKDIQVVFQDPFGSLNPKMKVGRFIEEPLRIHKVCRTRQERKQKVLEMMSLVGLEPELYDRYPQELSGGQRQRISIAAALILNPGLVIADEPVSAVDLTVEAQILRLLKELHQQFHITFLFISHDRKLVKNLCDRIAVMEHGKIVAVGAPEEVLPT